MAEDKARKSLICLREERKLSSRKYPTVGCYKESGTIRSDFYSVYIYYNKEDNWESNEEPSVGARLRL